MKRRVMYLTSSADLPEPVGPSRAMLQVVSSSLELLFWLLATTLLLLLLLVVMELAAVGVVVGGFWALTFFSNLLLISANLPRTVSKLCKTRTKLA